MVKKIFISSAMVLALSVASMANDSKQGVQIKTSIETIPMFKAVGAKIQDMIVHENFYQIKAQTTLGEKKLFQGFVTKDYKNVILGSAFDTKTGKPLMFKLDTTALKEASAYKRGSGKNEYFLFTNPLCHYCIKLETDIKSIKDDATVYTIFLPMPKMFPGAEDMMLHVLSLENDELKEKAIFSMINGSKEYQNTMISSAQRRTYLETLSKSKAIADSLGITGTPTIVDSNGYKVNPGIFANFAKVRSNDEKHKKH